MLYDTIEKWIEATPKGGDAVWLVNSFFDHVYNREVEEMLARGWTCAAPRRYIRGPHMLFVVSRAGGVVQAVGLRVQALIGVRTGEYGPVATELLQRHAYSVHAGGTRT